VGDLMKRYLDRGFIFLMTCLGVAVFIFWFTDPHDPGSFNNVVSFGVPAWFAVNAVERWAIDRLRVQQDGTAPK